MLQTPPAAAVPATEPCDVVEPTVIAALNMNYPGAKMTIHVLDDGRRPEMEALVRKLNFQARYVLLALCCCFCWHFCIVFCFTPVAAVTVIAATACGWSFRRLHLSAAVQVHGP